MRQEYQNTVKVPYEDTGKQKKGPVVSAAAPAGNNEHVVNENDVRLTSSRFRRGISEPVTVSLRT
jgi:hypothetical protein